MERNNAKFLFEISNFQKGHLIIQIFLNNVYISMFLYNSQIKKHHTIVSTKFRNIN